MIIYMEIQDKPLSHAHHFTFLRVFIETYVELDTLSLISINLGHINHIEISFLLSNPHLMNHWFGRFLADQVHPTGLHLGLHN